MRNLDQSVEYSLGDFQVLGLSGLKRLNSSIWTVTNGIAEPFLRLNGMALAFKYPRTYMIDDDG